MFSVSRDDLMAYCRADSKEQGDLAVAQAEAAEAWLTGIGVQWDEATAPTYCLVVKALALHWMDNPTLKEVPVGLRHLINFLKHCD